MNVHESTTKTPLLPGNWYHIYNRGINGERLFYEEENYLYFLRLLTRYVLNVAEVYAYCLLVNHFHLLVRIFDQPAKPPHQVFSHLFNSYAQSINKRYDRTGSLFERPFHRRLIDSERYRAANANRYWNGSVGARDLWSTTNENMIFVRLRNTSLSLNNS